MERDSEAVARLLDQARCRAVTVRGLEQTITDLVLFARANGATWQEIAAAIGTTRFTAKRRYDDSPGMVRLDDDERQTMIGDPDLDEDLPPDPFDAAAPPQLDDDLADELERHGL